MIGVLCKKSEQGIVQEFFQLFKTPWEFYRKEKTYPIVISSLPDVPAVDAGLLIFYSSLPVAVDARIGLLVEPFASDRFPCPDGACLPIYGSLSSLCGAGNPLTCDVETGQALAIQFTDAGRKGLRVGYDLFQEIEFLLTEGQPTENALIPSLELHISLLREWILGFGIPFVEIPPIPWGYSFMVCLTHDVDFAGIRPHKFDHTMWGFIYRATVSPLLAFIRGRYPISKLVKNWAAVLSLPLVYIGIIRDFWDEFDQYIVLDKEFLSTFFIVPFKDVVGEGVTNKFSPRRAVRYEIEDIQGHLKRLISEGYEIGLHGIDAWNNLHKGKLEFDRIRSVTGQLNLGVRIHWLCFDKNSPVVLEQADFNYDSTIGYNEAVGYKAGTTQVFLPVGARRLLEIPLHIQDTALFHPQRLSLSDAQAWDLCHKIIDTSMKHGGVLTILWHMRSLSPERLWGDFYRQLLQVLKTKCAWSGTASQVVGWFRQRRSVQFEDSTFKNGKLHLKLNAEGVLPEPRMTLRIHKAQDSQTITEASYIDFPYTGEVYLELPLS